MPYRLNLYRVETLMIVPEAIARMRPAIDRAETPPPQSPYIHAWSIKESTIGYNRRTRNRTEFVAG